jgi:rfaE bifunctional protein kinase chain/domain
VRLVSHPKSYQTPVKTRILAGARHSAPQQVVRVDIEPQSGRDLRIPWGKARRRLRDADAILLSDYGYGAANPDAVAVLRRILGSRAVPITVDSRFRMAEFHGVSALTPNITELEAAARMPIGGDRDLLRRIGRKVLRRQNLQALLVTQGRFGMTLLQPRRIPLHIPIYGSDEVADVTGAGDTVIAVFTLALACGGTPEEGARLANYAGGIVVMKRGTATVRREELQDAVSRDLAAVDGGPRS